jgi:hypothetical protein
MKSGDGAGVVKTLAPLSLIGDPTAQEFTGLSYALEWRGLQYNEEIAITLIMKSSRFLNGREHKEYIIGYFDFIADSYKNGSNGARKDMNRYARWLNLRDKYNS